MKRYAVFALLLLACDGGKPAEDEADPEANIRIGQLMVETGHRFETSGRAAMAGRWGLARYEAHEIIELFQTDMTRALLPGECNDDISDPAYFAVMDERLPALVAAAEREDREAYEGAFAATAAQCNTCHATCGVPFIEVPTAPGLEVPRVEALGEPTPAREEAAEDADADEAEADDDGEEPPAENAQDPYAQPFE